MGKVGNVKIILISITLLLSLYPQGKMDAKYRDPADSTYENQILETVVQIRAYAPSPNSGLVDQGQVRINARGNLERVIEIEYSVEKGLGTLFSTGNERVIVTHNHWGDMLTAMSFVRFFSENGDLLLQIESDEFRDLIRYQDNGTLVLNAPEGLNSIPFTSVAGTPIYQKIDSTDPANPGMPGEGDFVLFTHPKSGAKDEVEVLEGYAESTGEFEGVPVFKVRVLNGSIIQNGNSGGGVWFEGHFIGNVWATEVKRAWSWQKFQFEESLTNLSYIAPFDPGMAK